MGTSNGYLVKITTLDFTVFYETFTATSMWGALKAAKRKWRYCSVRLAS